MPDTCVLVFVHVRHIRQNFGTRTYGDFMVIVEPCSFQTHETGKNRPKIVWSGR